KERPANKPLVRIENPKTSTGSKRLKTITVIDIVNDDMPFLLDSVMGALAEEGASVHLVAHPIFAVERDKNGKLRSWKVTADKNGKARRESFIHIHVDTLDKSHRDKIAVAINAALGDVRRAVSDWREMIGRLHAAVAQLKKKPPPLPKEEVAEAA